jgi:hypothetical protein
MPCKLGDLKADLRTREARGDGTDVRLVLLELRDILDCLDALDTQIAGHTGGRLIADDGDLQAALGDGRDELAVLAREWCAFDLEEVTTRSREITDLLDLLLRGARA